MKKIISLILAVALVFSFALSAVALEVGRHLSNSTATSSLHAIDFTTDNAKILGRTNEAYPFLIGHHSSGVEFNVTGTSVVGVRLEPYAAWRHWAQELYFEIDGEQVVIPNSQTAQGNYDYIIATDLDPNTTHNVKVIMDQENWGQYWQRGFYFRKILVDNENATVTKAKDGNYKILVYGDSITSAGNIGGVHLSYHQLMAKNFNADTQAISASGGYFASSYIDKDNIVQTGSLRIGRDWKVVAWQPTWAGEFSDGDADAMQKMADANEDGIRDEYETDLDNIKFPADLVLINIGTNDGPYLDGWNGGDHCEENRQTFKTDFYAMLDEMFGLNGGAGYYPDTTVMLTYGLMGTYGNVPTFYREMVAEYLENNPSLKGDGVTTKDKVVVFFYTQAKYGTVSAEDKHPNAASHAYAAEELTAFVSDYMGWEVVGDAIEATPNNNGIIEKLPSTPVIENQLFVGFTSENGSFVAKGDAFTWGDYIYRNYLAVQLGGKVSETVNVNDPNPVPTDAEYTNSFYIQGAQVRVGLTPEDKATGLRFIVVNNTEVKKALETAITQNFEYERGVVVAAGTRFPGGILEIGSNGATKVPAEKIFASTATLKANYDKYTACVINIPEKYLAIDVFVRPYFKYIDASGLEHIYYGEQYACSIYSAAKLAYGNESDAVNEYLYNNILSKCKGDNDLNLDF